MHALAPPPQLILLCTIQCTPTIHVCLYTHSHARNSPPPMQSCPQHACLSAQPRHRAAPTSAHPRHRYAHSHEHTTHTPTLKPQPHLQMTHTPTLCMLFFHSQHRSAPGPVPAAVQRVIHRSQCSGTQQPIQRLLPGIRFRQCQLPPCGHLHPRLR